MGIIDQKFTCSFNHCLTKAIFCPTHFKFTNLRTSDGRRHGENHEESSNMKKKEKKRDINMILFIFHIK